jgi:hypothetical protein
MMEKQIEKKLMEDNGNFVKNYWYKEEIMME